MTRGIAIHVRYLGPTTYRGARWVATADHPRIARAVVPYSHEAGGGMDNAQTAAEALIARWRAHDGYETNVLAAGGFMPDGSYVLVATNREVTR